MRRWARQNRAGLVALAVAVPALLAAQVLLPALEPSEAGSAPREVAAGASGTAGGLTFSVRAAGSFGAPQGLRTPPGAELVAAVVDVRPAAERPTATLCTLRLTAPGGGDRQRWDTTTGTAQYGYARGADFATGCDARAGTQAIEAVFLAPAGTSSRASIDVTVSEGARTTVLRLALPPARTPTPAPTASTT